MQIEGLTGEQIGRKWAAATGRRPQRHTFVFPHKVGWPEVTTFRWFLPGSPLVESSLPAAVSQASGVYDSESDAYLRLGDAIRSAVVFAQSVSELREAE
jgi:hypothetical protein